MKRLFGTIVAALLLTACASGGENARVQELYKKYDAHCKKHARDMAPDADDELRYRECMDYFIGNDDNCPHCEPDQYMLKE